MTFVAWDWGHLAVHLIWMGVGVLVGFWAAALMAAAGDGEDNDYHRP